MLLHPSLTDAQLRSLIRSGNIRFGGNARLKIYGLLSCMSGKRMNRVNRVFFSSEEDAREHGYRPCGHCLREAYQLWKQHGTF